MQQVLRKLKFKEKLHHVTLMDTIYPKERELVEILVMNHFVNVV
jgi:hypothetical protein